jgi:hypothetical protein
MKYLVLVVGVFLISGISRSATENIVFINGRIGNAFTKTEIQVIDDYNQKFFLKKDLFPQGFKFTSKEKFSIEIRDSIFDNIKVLNNETRNK